MKCSRCGRELRPWPLERGDRCAPADWVYCIRPAPILEPCSCDDPDCTAQVEFVL